MSSKNGFMDAWMGAEKKRHERKGQGRKGQEVRVQARTVKHGKNGGTKVENKERRTRNEEEAEKKN